MYVKALENFRGLGIKQSNKNKCEVAGEPQIGGMQPQAQVHLRHNGAII